MSVRRAGTPPRHRLTTVPPGRSSASNCSGVADDMQVRRDSTGLQGQKKFWEAVTIRRTLRTCWHLTPLIARHARHAAPAAKYPDFRPCAAARSTRCRSTSATAATRAACTCHVAASPQRTGDDGRRDGGPRHRGAGRRKIQLLDLTAARRDERALPPPRHRRAVWAACVIDRCNLTILPEPG